jgi:hypothetical protein
MDIKKIADEVIPAASEVAAELKKLHGINMATLQAAFQMLPGIVKRVESVGKIKDLTGAEKQELAIELIIRMRPSPWWLPTPLYRQLLGWAIDSTVAALKDRFE